MNDLLGATEALAIRRRVRARIAESPAVPRSALRSHMMALVAEEAPLLSSAAAAPLVETLIDDLTGLGPLEAILRDTEVTEIMVNGDSSCWIERAGQLECLPMRVDADELLRIVERVITPLGLRLDRSSPMVDARLPDGARLHAVIAPVAIDGPCLTIRRFGATPVPLEAFDPDEACISFLQRAIECGANMVIAGGTGAGKTTLLNALGAFIDTNARIVTIEETAELRLPGRHVLRLEARSPNAEGAGAVTVRDLVRTALRMRPDRIIVGEVRGAEVLDMLQALNTGHSGSATTLHANGALEALHRIESLALLGGGEIPLAAVRAHIAAAIDLIIVVARGVGGSRRIVQIAEVSPPGTRLAVIDRWVRGRGLIEGPASRPSLRTAAVK
ncbi:MAG: CpaF family protein [Actinobacteria bacterium]|uniref:Unannotated protein n=1 Tax=freshwater metagenome TaxID=449393 RepID=A0A6J7MZM5_9ZZZZ|nr:CpaF family protein [Actinomycetota bacterium]